MTLPPPAMTKPPSSAEISSDYVRTLIFTGVLRTGDKVPIDEIADMIGISRQPVREAVIELANDGLVEIDGRRGTFVAAFGPDTVRDHYELLGMLESFAVRRVAERRDAEVLERLRELERAAKAAPDNLERKRLVIELLRTLNRAAGNARLRMVMRSMSRFTPGDYYLTHVPDAVQDNAKTLRAMLDAIEAGDAERGAMITVEMWRRTGERLIDHLSATGVFDAD
jgi:DNA-binding GntR family transcriptional regulator